LPQPRDTRLYLEHSTSVPNVIHFKLIGHRRAWAYERHLATHDVPKLGKLIEARLT
jgi:hypothetical protein